MNSTTTKTIDDLPIEMLEEILKNLDINDLFNCRLVSKKFELATQQIKIDELNFINYNLSQKMKNHIIKFNYSNPLHSKILQSSIFNFSQLKKLKIWITTRPKTTIDTNVINKFVHLEELELDIQNLTFQTDDALLCLPNLKVFEFDIFGNSNQISLIVDAINLKKFIYLVDHETYSNNKIVIKYPNTIKYYGTYDFEKNIFDFKNLEYLDFQITGDIELSDLLNQLSLLKEIYIQPFGDHEDIIKQIKTIRKLLREKELLKHKVDIYFDGDLIQNIQQTDALIAELIDEMDF